MQTAPFHALDGFRSAGSRPFRRSTDGSYPSDCGGTFDPNAIKSIDADLNKYWPSLNGGNAAFWQHEFEKHGTCATDVFPTELDFFNGTLALRAAYDIVPALAAAGISPSNTQGFTKSAFGAALKAAYGYTAVIVCDADGWISTAVQCIAKDLSLMACPSNVKSACTPSTVYLPNKMAAGRVRAPPAASA
jgi:ribonuclease T2